MKLSVCIITKNECIKLEKCIRALLPYGFEIVVSDTGSTDGTQAMVEKYGCKLLDFPWINDFSAAKNFTILNASNDYVLIVDSDEYLQELNIEKLYQLVKENPDGVGRTKILSRMSENGEDICISFANRLFDRRKFHYEGKVHEQVVRGSVFGWQKEEKTKENKMEYKTYCASFIFEHDGYMGTIEERKQKANRNIELLRKELEEEPDDTYLLYQVGKSYYMSEMYSEALEYFNRALRLEVNPKMEYVIDLVETYGYTLLNLGQAQDALLLEGVYEEFSNSADFLFLMGLIYMNNELFDEAVAEFLKATKKPSAKTVGVNSYLAFYNAGIIRECLGDFTQAREFYKKCGNYEKARKRLQEIASK